LRDEFCSRDTVHISLQVQTAMINHINFGPLYSVSYGGARWHSG